MQNIETTMKYERKVTGAERFFSHAPFSTVTMVARIKGEVTGEMLNRNSYGVYIIHVVLIGVFGTLLLNTGLSAVVKWILLVISTYVVSNLIVSTYYAVKRK